MFVNFNILNQLGSPAINSNTFANRPAAGQTGRLFVSTDTFEIYRDNGTSWDLIGGPGTSTITGTGTATQVAYFTSSQAIGSSANLYWDNTNGYLGVGTATPGARIEAVKTDGYGIYANYTTNVGSGASTTAIYAINNTASSGYAAVIEEKTGNTTGGQYPLLIKHSLSSGTAAVGNGTGLQFQLQDDAGTFKTTQLTIETIDAAAATYSTRYRFNVQNNGSSTPMAYLNATGLGIKTATPLGLIHADGGASAARIILDADSGVAKIFSFRTDALPRWAFRVDGAETGSNAGADFALRSYDDTGALLISPLSVTRANGKASWQATETYSTGLARANYFDYNLSVPAATSFTSPNAITALGASLDLTLAGNATIPSGARTGLDAYNSVSFTGAGTLTMTQGTQIRPYSNITAGWAFNGSAVGTITHLAGLRVLFPDNSGSTVNVTNNYALLINDQTANTGTVTYTNRWGIYQEGASDLNYFNANTLIGTTTNSGQKLQVNGNAILIGTATGNVNLAFGTQSGTAGWSIGNGIIDNTHNFRIYDNTAGLNRVTLDGSGNLGLGVQPSAWYNAGGYVALQVGNASLFGRNSANSELYLSANSFDNSTGTPTYITTDFATRYLQNDGIHAWYTAPSGTAGNSITFTQAMTLDASGRLGLGIAGPNRTLSIYQASAPVLQLINSTTGTTANDGFLITMSGSDVVLENGEVGYLGFRTSATERARITSGGNFLIGTTTDEGQKFQVNGTASINGLITQGGGIYGATGQFSASGSTTTSFYTFTNSNTNKVYFITVRQAGSGANTVTGMAFLYAGNTIAYNLGQDNTNPVLLLTLSMSGNSIQLTTGSGYGTTTWEYTITIIKD
jgi:hypothetical protein